MHDLRTLVETSEVNLAVPGTQHPSLLTQHPNVLHMHCTIANSVSLVNLIVVIMMMMMMMITIVIIILIIKKLLLASERDTYRGNTIENRGCLFICIHVWTYVCQFVL